MNDKPTQQFGNRILDLDWKRDVDPFALREVEFSVRLPRHRIPADSTLAAVLASNPCGPERSVPNRGRTKALYFASTNCVDWSIGPVKALPKPPVAAI